MTSRIGPGIWPAGSRCCPPVSGARDLTYSVIIIIVIVIVVDT